MTRSTTSFAQSRNKYVMATYTRPCTWLSSCLFFQTLNREFRPKNECEKCKLSMKEKMKKKQRWKELPGTRGQGPGTRSVSSVAQRCKDPIGASLDPSWACRYMHKASRYTDTPDNNRPAPSHRPAPAVSLPHLPAPPSQACENHRDASSLLFRYSTLLASFYPKLLRGKQDRYSTSTTPPRRTVSVSAAITPCRYPCCHPTPDTPLRSNASRCAV